MSEIDLTKNNFEEEVLKSDKPVVVDFWATWCGPCRMLAPVLSEFAEKHADKIKVCKVNVDEDPGLANTYNIYTIPCLLFFKKGEVVATSVGLKSLEELEEVFGIL